MSRRRPFVPARYSGWQPRVAMLVLMGLVVSSGALVATAARAETRVRVGALSTISMAPAPLTAVSNGLFAKHGLNVEMRWFLTGPEIIQSLGAGELDIGIVGNAPAISALAAGVPLKIVSVGMGGGARESLLVRVNDPAQRLEDLKGRKVGLVAGSDAEMFLRTQLKARGLKFQDVTIINVKPTEQPAALQLGQVDAVYAWEPTPALIVVKGIGRRILDADEVGSGSNAIVARQEFLGKHPDAVATFLKAMHEATAYNRANAERVVDQLQERLRLDRAVLLDAVPRQLWYVEVFQEDVQLWQAAADFLYEEGKLRKKVTVMEHLDLAPLERALGATYPLAGRALDRYKYPTLRRP
ncbi:MAG: aliphatic sulfonate ABC transporter substrate-binding protein [Candidatus Rokubacteria bacterium]|nr:aliphatic sulfonate ABC transporter substrate-binding protein [Candidatus Rokubacteria bacterium]